MSHSIVCDDSIFRTCNKCKESKMIFNFGSDKKTCKDCEKKARGPSMRDILAKNEMLTMPNWNLKKKKH